MKPNLVSPDIEPNHPGPAPPLPSPPPVGTPWSAIGPLPRGTPPSELHATAMDLVHAPTVLEVRVPAIVREQPMSCTIGATASPTLLLVSIVAVAAFVRRARRSR